MSFCSCDLTFGLPPLYQSELSLVQKLVCLLFHFQRHSYETFICFSLLLVQLLISYLSNRQTALFACFCMSSLFPHFLFLRNLPLNCEPTLAASVLCLCTQTLLLAEVSVDLCSQLFSDKARSVLHCSFSLFSLALLPQNHKYLQLEIRQEQK